MSCRNIFAPKLGELDGGNSIYRMDMENPADVLHNFRYAYIYRDSLIYSMCLDSEFVFTYYDVNDEAGGHYDSWLLDTELKTTGRLFRTFSYIDLLWLTTLDSTYMYMENDSLLQTEKTYFTSANFAETVNSFQLTIGDYMTVIGTAEFLFRKGKDGKWRLLGWTDKYSSY